MERYLSSRIRPDLASVSAPLSWRVSGGRPRPSGCNQFRTVRRKPVEREERSGKGEEEALSRSQKGLTDTWSLNGANLRAPAVTLLIR